METLLSPNDNFSKKVKADLFGAVRRSLWRLHDAEDRFQEGIAQTWLAYRRHYEATGELLGDATLIGLCRRRAWSRRDHFVPRPCGRWSLDVVEVLFRRREYKRMVSDSDISERGERPDLDLCLDLSRVLKLLNDADREILLGFMAGESTRELGKRLGSSSSSISRRGQGLERRLRAVLSGAL